MDNLWLMVNSYPLGNIQKTMENHHLDNVDLLTGWGPPVMFVGL